MKICPNCHSKVDDTYDMCWNCCYSFPEDKVIDPEELKSNPRNICCLRCKDVPMVYTGVYKFLEGARMGVWGNLFELFQNRESFEIYLCPQCGKAEFFSPEDTAVILDNDSV